MKEIAEKVRVIIEPLLSEKGFELYDIEYKKENRDWVLRIFADNKNRNITLDDCASISNHIESLLDQHEELKLDAYNLEVSSPGLDRLLKNDSDFAWAMGKTLKVKFTNNESKKEVVEGKLESFNDETLELSLPKKVFKSIKKDSIESARRVMKFDELVPKEKKIP
jgi:ribosome maturation factor RimP